MTIGARSAPRAAWGRVRERIAFVGQQGRGPYSGRGPRSRLSSCCWSFCSRFSRSSEFSTRPWVHAFFGVKEGTEKFRILEFVGVGMGGVFAGHRGDDRQPSRRGDGGDREAAGGGQPGRGGRAAAGAAEERHRASGPPSRIRCAWAGPTSSSIWRGTPGSCVRRRWTSSAPTSAGRRGETGISGKVQGETVGRGPEPVDPVVCGGTRSL